jgi:hypothetical protein
MSTARSLPRSRAWLRALVLLLALLVPGAHAEVHATPVVSMQTAEYDVLDAALRPSAPAAHRPVAPDRPALLPDPAPEAPGTRTLPAPPRPPYALRTLRTAVLRC